MVYHTWKKVSEDCPSPTGGTKHYICERCGLAGKINFEDIYVSDGWGGDCDVSVVQSVMES